MKQDLIAEILSHLAQINDPIAPELYGKYDVKRGLRYNDGRGVLVGLTNIGDVVGYEMRGDQKIAIPGKLFYRGYDVEDLVKDADTHHHFGFEQTAYLLLFGELPAPARLQDFRELLGQNRPLPEDFTEDMILKAPSPDIMNKLARSVLASYSYDPDADNVSLTNVLRQCIGLIARFPVMAAYGYQAKRHYCDGKSLYLHNPDPERSTAENFLRLIRSNRQYTPLEAEILDLSLILHAEHGGGNNSTFAVHVVSSADTDTYSAIASAIGSLKGKRHGGASLRVMDMMDDIKAHLRDWDNRAALKEYLRKIVRKQAFDRTGLIYGQGHAVYTISDPRAILIRDRAQKLAEATGRMDEYCLYRNIENLAPEVICEEVKTDKQICANVDFYSGFVYSMLQIPRALFTPLFAVSRIAGWSAHRIEEVVAGSKIYRPAFKNIGQEHSYIPLYERK
jgi:citrate synthase